MSLVRSALGPGGALSQFLPGFTYRREQVQVAEAISEAFQSQLICLAEAGTGVGKTMSYLVPAIEQIREGKTVVISTHTLNLQGQLIRKDIPLLREAVGEPSFEAVLVKGMGNYLCKFLLQSEGGLPLLDRDETFRRIQVWAADTETGDIAELPFYPRGWSEIACDSDICHRQDCHFYDSCHYFNMRRSADRARLIITNHALFFSDLAIRVAEPRAGILPPYDLVVFDEAHHLEEVALKVFGIEFSNYRIPSFLNRLRRLRGAALAPGLIDSVDRFSSELFSRLEPIRKQEFFLTDVFDDQEMKQLYSEGSQLCILLQELHTQIVGLARDTLDENEGLRERLDGYARTCSRLQSELNLLLFEENEDWFVWGQKPSQPNRVIRGTLYRTPMHVADIMAEKFWPRLKGGALVSATLSNSGGFSYVRSRLGLPEEVVPVVVGSPFNFREQSLLYVPGHLPFPSSAPEYAAEVTQEIARLLTFSKGRAFLLFTSYRMLDAVHSALLSQLSFPLLRQGEMPNAALLEEFRKTPNACLFGTSSFWEGVDVQGEALSCVVIDKLPFSVPDTPVARARIAAVEAAGGNAFNELSVPEAQIRLKQGFGRLIRTGTDRGVVAILDSRLIKKSYGRSFLQVLPPARFTRSPDDVRRFFASVGAPTAASVESK